MYQKMSQKDKQPRQKLYRIFHNRWQKSYQRKINCLFKKLLFTTENATAAGSSWSNISRLYIWKDNMLIMRYQDKVNNTNDTDDKSLGKEKPRKKEIKKKANTSNTSYKLQKVSTKKKFVDKN